MTYRELETLDQTCGLRIRQLLKHGHITKAESERLQGHVEQAMHLLCRLHRMKPAKQRLFVRDLVVCNYDLKIACILRTSLGQDTSYLKIKAHGEAMRMLFQCDEPIKAYWREQVGKWRVVCQPGPVRRAHQLMVADILHAMIAPSSFDYSRKGMGGVAGAVRAVARHMRKGRVHWSTPDLTNCFPSVRPGHFKELNLDKRLLGWGFLPKWSTIHVTIPEEGQDKIRKVLIKKLGEDVGTSVTAIADATGRLVRQGLTLGAVTSQPLCGWLIGRIIGDVPETYGTAVVVYADNVAIGAHFPEVVANVVAILKLRAELPAGHLEFHDDQVVHRSKVAFLGYRFEEEPGQQGKRIHIKPTAKSFARYEQRLLRVMQRADENGEDVWAAARVYALRWFAAQGAWTKIDGLSYERFMKSLTAYFSDFCNGLPLGTFYAENNLKTGDPTPAHLLLGLPVAHGAFPTPKP